MALTIRLDLEGDPSGAPPAPDDPSTDEEATQLRPTPTARRCPTCEKPFSGVARFCPYDGDPLVEAPDWNPAADALIGETIEGRYKVESVLGEGGMGTVYEVRHATLGRRFAMKVLRRDVTQDAELTARFIQEAKAAAAIGHPNIVAVTDFGELPAERIPGGRGRVPFFVMELLRGRSLAAELKREGTLKPVRAAHLFQQCASALSAAHRAGVIHRDLKPDNVFIADPGDREFVKLLDFGVAKMAGAGRLTRAGMVYGTPHYMSPEQAAGQPCDARADVYALGVIMYECFAGRVPFEADTYMGVLTQHLFAVPAPIETVSPSTSRLGALGMLIMRCLAKKPEDRYASMDEVADAITLAVEDPREAARAALGGAEPKGGFRLRESNPAPVARSSEPPPIPGVAPRRGLVVGGVIALGLVIGAFALVRGPHGGPTTAGSATGAQVEAPAANLETPSPSAAPSAEPSVAPVASASAPSVEAPSASPANSGKAPTTAPRSPPGVPSPRPPRTGGKHKGEVVDPWAN